MSTVTVRSPILKRMKRLGTMGLVSVLSIISGEMLTRLHKEVFYRIA